MVKLGFICEGITETVLLSSRLFKEYLNSIGIELINVINAKGSGNLLPHNITVYLDLLEKQKVDKIIILTDLDDDVCITKTKKRINARSKDIVIIAVKEIEAWFLASTLTMSKLLNDERFYFDNPEQVTDPFEAIHQLKLAKTGRGLATNKKRLANMLIGMHLSIKEAAAHPNCPSAKYFTDTLTRIGRGIKSE